MHAILQHCYFKVPLFQSHYLTGCLRLKSRLKCLLIDLDTPLCPLNIRGLVLESQFIDGFQNAVWHPEM